MNFLFGRLVFKSPMGLQLGYRVNGNWLIWAPLPHQAFHLCTIEETTATHLGVIQFFTLKMNWGER